MAVWKVDLSSEEIAIILVRLKQYEQELLESKYSNEMKEYVNKLLNLRSKLESDGKQLKEVNNEN